jgi:hypothetical protein
MALGLVVVVQPLQAVAVGQAVAVAAHKTALLLVVQLPKGLVAAQLGMALLVVGQDMLLLVAVVAQAVQEQVT